MILGCQRTTRLGKLHPSPLDPTAGLWHQHASSPPEWHVSAFEKRTLKCGSVHSSFWCEREGPKTPTMIRRSCDTMRRNVRVRSEGLGERLTAPRVYYVFSNPCKPELHLRCPHLHPENKLRFRLVMQVHRSTSTPNSSEAGVLAAGDRKTNVSIKLHQQKKRLEKERCL